MSSSSGFSSPKLPVNGNYKTHRDKNLWVFVLIMLHRLLGLVLFHGMEAHFALTHFANIGSLFTGNSNIILVHLCYFICFSAQRTFNVQNNPPLTFIKFLHKTPIFLYKHFAEFTIIEYQDIAGHKRTSPLNREDFK